MHQPLYAKLAAMYSSEKASENKLDAIAEELPNSQWRARLRVLAAFSRAHQSRLLARMKAVRSHVVTQAVVHPSSLNQDVLSELRRETEIARLHAHRYQEMAEMSRQYADLSTAWICELNRTEELDRVKELTTVAKSLENMQVKSMGERAEKIFIDEFCSPSIKPANS